MREAQILGKAVVITNFPTAKGQLSHGFDGWITPMGVEGIVEGIKTLIEDTELKTRLISNTMQVDYGNSSEIEKLYEIFNQQNK